jgi:hypothetical protein
MQLTRDRFICEHCADAFTPKARGRRPLYCSRTCRQRAYEARRRAAYHLRRPAEQLAFPPARTERRRPAGRDRPRHEAGCHREIVHALRPDGPANHHGHRPTLCGALTRPFPSLRRFGDRTFPHWRPCRTCSAIVDRYPLERPIEPSADLSRITYLLRASRHAIVAGHDAAKDGLLEQLVRLTA